MSEETKQDQHEEEENNASNENELSVPPPPEPAVIEPVIDVKPSDIAEKTQELEDKSEEVSSEEDEKSSEEKESLETESDTETDEIQANESETQEVPEDDTPKFVAPVNEEALKKQITEYQRLKTEVDKIEADLESITDYRNTRKKIVSLRELISALFLIESEKKNELIEKIQKIFEYIQEKQDRERENINQVYAENLERLKPEFDKTIEDVQKLEIYKEARKSLIDLQKKVRETKIKASDKDNLLSQIQEGFDKVNEKEQAERESFEMEASENYLKLKPKVSSISEAAKNTEKFNDARKALIELQNEVKEAKLTRVNKDELFSTIREAFTIINDKQDKERAEFLEVADKNYEEAKKKVDEAIEFAADPANIANSRNKLIETQNYLKDIKLTRQKRDELFGAIRTIFSQLNEGSEENKEEFEKEANLNFAKLEVKVNEAVANVEYSEDFRDIREGLVMVQDEVKILKLKRQQRNELLSRIRKGFEKFDKKRKDYSDRRKAEKTSKLKSIVENLLEKNKNIEEILTADKQSLAELESSLESATEDDKPELEKKIKSFNDKISSREQNLKANQDRIEDINKELEKLEK